MKTSIKFWNKQAKGFNSETQPEMDSLIQQSKPYLSHDFDVLDFACGTGYSTMHVAPLVKTIHGIDYSDEMIRYAKEKQVNTEVANIVFSEGTIDSLIKAYPNKQYDVILAYNVLHLLPNTEESIHQMFRLLKPSGVLITNTVCLNEKKNLAAYLVKGISKLGIFPDLNSYSIKGLEQMLVQAGIDTLQKKSTNSGVTNLFMISKKRSAHM